MKRKHLGVALAACCLLGCQTPPTTAPDGVGLTPAGAAPRPQPSYAPPTAPAAQEVLSVGVALKPVPGGATMADLDRDEDADDDFEPVLPVVFQVPGYGEGLTAANAEMKVRGHSTRGASQKSYAIKLAKDAPLWGGSKHVLLNKHPYDLTRVRNKLSFDLFKGLPHLQSLETQFAQLTVDGQDYGLFTRIERPDERFLAAHGLDPKGSLYKAEMFEFHRYADQLKLSTDAGYDEKAFESVLEIEGAKDHTRLLAMLDAVNDEETPINDTIARYFDRENYLTWLAVNVLVGNMDTNSQNFLLYAPSGEGRWQFIPWDYDGAWGFWDQPDQKAEAAQAVGRWQEGLANWWGVVLHRRFMQQPENLAELNARIEDMATRYFTADRIQLHLDSYRETVKPFVSRDPDAKRLPTAGADPATAWEAEVKRLPGVIQTNLARYRAGLERPMPVFLGDPKAQDGGLAFAWDASHDLQGDALTYDFQMSRSPAFGAGDLVVDQQGLTATRTVVAEALPAGSYYYRVIVRDAKSPAEHWQIPFDTVYENGRVHRGMRRLTLPL